MNNNIQFALSVLKPRIDNEIVEGIYEVLLDDTKTKFYAFTYLPIDKERYYELSYFLGKFSSYGSYCDHEKTKKYLDDNCWQSKSTEECIEEGIFTYYAITFIGMNYEGTWYVDKWLSYFGDNITEPEAKKILKFNGYELDLWNLNFFIPKKSYHLPDGSIARDVEDEEFENFPSIVATTLKEKKNDINRAFRRYINEEVFIPFADKLRIKDPSNYTSFCHMFSEDFELIFPEHKKYVLMAAVPKNENGIYRIEYFIYSQQEKSIFKWIYPGDHFLESYHEYFEEIIQDISQISTWNDRRFLNSSRTLDDENFWNEYVFKKERDKYLYLVEVTF